MVTLVICCPLFIFVLSMTLRQPILTYCTLNLWFMVKNLQNEWHPNSICSCFHKVLISSLGMFTCCYSHSAQMMLCHGCLLRHMFYFFSLNKFERRVFPTSYVTGIWDTWADIDTNPLTQLWTTEKYHSAAHIDMPVTGCNWFSFKV